MVSEKVQCSHIKENGERCGNKKLKKNIPEDKRDNWKCHQHREEDISQNEELTFNELKQELTEKQKVFADEYIISLNATEAAKKAGYSENSARQVGSENLSKPYIQQYIQKRLEQKEEERIASQDEVLEYLTRVMRGEESDILSGVSDKGPVVREVDPDLNERTKAAKLLGKRYAMFKEVKDVNHEGAVQIIDDIE